MTLAECNLMGWCSPAKERWLIEWIREHKPQVLVELGVFGGSCLLPMALEAMSYPSKAVGVDPWNIDACLEGMTGDENRAWWSKNSELSRVETSCRQAIRDLGLTNTELWRGKSDDFVSSFQDGEIGLLSIDGNHSAAQAMADAQNYLRKVRVGGLIACDDIGWMEGDVLTVQAMVDWLLSNDCHQIGTVTDCALLIKTDDPF